MLREDVFTSKHIILTVAASLVLAGCGPKAVKRVCMGTGSGADDPLLSGAAMLRLDVYGADVHCNGSLVGDGAGAPVMSHTYAQGDVIKLDVPPGPHTLVLTTFADAAGTMPLGEGCLESDLSAGGQLCFDLTLTDAPQPPVADLSAVGIGCASDTDCAGSGSAGSDGGVAGTPFCDPGTHVCVQCVNDAQCGSGGTCCGGRCANLLTDVGNCGACGRACSTSNVATAACAAGVCASSCVAGYDNCVKPAAPTADDGCETNTGADPDNCGACGRSCSSTNVATRSCGGGVCTSSCAGGFGNCATPAAPAADDGCETNTTNDTSHCGSCSTVCAAPAHEGATCVSSTCGGGACTSGYDDCNGSVSDGCECRTDPAAPACCGSGCQTVHNNGYGGNYFDCNALGQPGVSPTTYSSVMANEAALSYTTQGGTASGGWFCGTTTTDGSGNTICKSTADCTASICKTAGNGKTGSCTCWVYDATGGYTTRIGHTFSSSTGGCLCPFPTDPSWN